MGRGTAPAWGSLGALWVLGSCTALGLGGPDTEVSLGTALAPEIAGWLAAQACRAEHPGADPFPLHPGAAILRHADDDFEIRYNRAPPHGYRVALNGRLLPPLQEMLAEGGQAMPLDTVSFQPADRWTGVRAPGPDEVAIRIRGADGGSRLTIQLSGAVVGGTLTQHLERVLALGEAIQETAVMVRRRQWGVARDRSRQALARFGPGCCGSHQPLRSRLLVHLASAEQAQGQLDAARAAVARALGLSPRTPGLRLWQARLDRRLALDRQAATDWHMLALSPTGDGFSSAAAGELRGSLNQLLQLAPGLDYRERADQLLRDNDVAGARSQLDMARSMDPVPETDLEGLRRWHHQQGRHRAAFEVALQRLERSEDPAAVLAVAELCADTDQSVLALRLIARHWDDLLEHDRAATESWLRVHTGRTGIEMAIRTLTAEGAVDLAQGVLARWMQTGRARPEQAEALAMIWWLRSERRANRGRDPDIELLEYESAPGVHPPR